MGSARAGQDVLYCVCPLTNEDDEAHRKAAETAQLVNEHEFQQIVNG